MIRRNFGEDLHWSQGQVRDTCEATIRDMLTGCVKIEKTDTETDKSGIDYYATLRRGARVGIDHKARRAGCSKFWKDGHDELALETWSVCPSDECPKGKAGWTLDESKQTDYTLHTFDPADSVNCYLIPFQLLRVSFRKHGRTWCEHFRVEKQCSGGWYSECVFVPIWCVFEAITEAMESRIAVGVR